MNLEIQTRQLELDPAWRDSIERQAKRLSERYPEMLQLHVTLTHLAHHRQGTEEVALLAAVEGATLRAHKREEHVHTAIHAAFGALETEIERHHRERRDKKGAPAIRDSPVSDRDRA